MHKFNDGDAFPHIAGETVAHGPVSLPEDIPEGNWALVLSYRADW